MVAWLRMAYFFKRTSVAALILGVGFLSVSVSRADDVYQIVIKKQEEKKKTRWSLQEWLETRDRMRLMDLWLAMNSPSPYEFYLGGDLQLLERSSAARVFSGSAYLGAFASIFGLEARKDFGPGQDWKGLFRLRVFGYHDQSTNLTFHAGVRWTLQPEDYRNAVAGYSMRIYLGKFFGIDHLGQYFFPSTPTGSGFSASGARFEVGGFIDFNILHFYAQYSWDRSTGEARSGPAGGVRIYF